MASRRSKQGRWIVAASLAALGAACSPGDAPSSSALPWRAPEPPVDAGALLVERIAAAEGEIAGRPGDALAVGRLGLLYEANEHWPQARACFARARALDPGEPTWFEHEAYLLRLEGYLEQALAVARAGLEHHPDDAALLDALATTALEAGRHDEALATFERLTLAHPGRARGPLGVGEVLQARGESARAIEHLERAVALDRRDARARYVLGCALRDVGRLAEAEVELRRGAGAARRRATDRWTEDLVELSLSRTVRNARAIEWMDQGRLTDARRLLEETVALDPNDPRTLSNLGLLYRRLGDAPRALFALERAAQLAPDSYQARTNFGQALIENGYVDEALVEARAALAAGPRVPQAHMLLSDVLYARGEREEGERELRAALDCAPEDVEMRLHAARRMEHEEAPERALALLAEAARIAPADPRPELALAALCERLGREQEAGEHAERARTLSGSRAEEAR